MAPDSRFIVPPGAVAHVRIIDSTTRITNIPAKTLFTPSVPGFEIVPENPTWCFLIESSSGGKAIFDLGVPPNWPDVFPPAVIDIVTRAGFECGADKHVADILQESDISPSDIDAVVWR